MTCALEPRCAAARGDPCGTTPRPLLSRRNDLRDRHTVVASEGPARFSLVYRAIDAVTERPVALRFLKVRRNLTPSQRTVIVERLGSLVSPMIEVADNIPRSPTCSK